ncbi:MAG: TonB-dependent receptor, partial [Bacteroidetes bacterium]|nr:TonB-dependent receptor [Bacteroidota bacterium]
AHVWQGFASWRFRISQGLTFNAGLHSMYFGLNKKYTLEPRASLKWQLNDQQYISAGFGIHSRRDGLSLYLARKEESDGSFIQPNRNLDFTKAMHFVLGYDVMFNKDLHLRVETYYQNLYDVPVFDDSSSVVSILNSVSPFTTQKLVNEGIGRNYGVEVTLEKFFSNNYYFLITSSLYQSKYTALDGIERNTRFNGNYVNNFLAGKDFPIGRNKNNLITTSARFIWAGGKRYTPVDETMSKELGYTVRDFDNAYGAKTSDYFRADISVGYVINKKTTTQTIKLDIQNVNNRTNVLSIYYSPRLDKLVEYTRGSIIPVLSYKLQF